MRGEIDHTILVPFRRLPIVLLRSSMAAAIWTMIDCFQLLQLLEMFFSLGHERRFSQSLRHVNNFVEVVVAQLSFQPNGDPFAFFLQTLLLLN